MPFLADEINLTVVLTLTPISIGMVTLMIFGLMDIYKGRFIINKDGLVSIGVFTTKTLRFEEIKGYTVNDQYIFVEPNAKGKKRIKISQYISGNHEILSWLSAKYEDLDLINAQAEEQEILNDKNIGWSKEIREEKLSNARKLSKVINWLGGLSFAWAYFYPKPYDGAVLSAFIIPIVALIVVKLSGGLIRVDQKNGSAYPSIIYALIFPSLGLMARAFFDYDIFDYSNVWLKAALVTIIFIFILLINQKEITFRNKQDFLTISSLIMFLFAYGFGAVIYLNCSLDKLEPEQYTATILEKRISTGKHTSYYLKLTAWGHQNEIDEVSVSKGLYKRVDIDTEINIYFRNGKLEIPWFIVTDRRQQ
ncbi:hypothetical protein PEDI_37710 [Persicobacter diffluens]|uniref:Uncharacterized protein n=2 Tax=Persicobacter diffluens TaxID=981 RepID=A0AAN5ALG3_9BACT|nr:hypothetical protein PEDI_37710 [Persicobacter diffluens]